MTFALKCATILNLGEVLFRCDIFHIVGSAAERRPRGRRRVPTACALQRNAARRLAEAWARGLSVVSRMLFRPHCYDRFKETCAASGRTLSMERRP